MPESWSNLLLVGAGGFLGSTLRYVIGGAVTRAVAPRAFPAGTFAVNVIGCFVIGALAATGDRTQAGGWSSGARLLLFTGVLGGFTTFSAFGLETFTMLRDGRWGMGAANVIGQLLLGLLGVWAGYSALSR